MRPEPSIADLAGPDASSVLTRLREQREVVRVEAIDGWLVTAHAAAVAVMRDSAGFTVDDPRFSTARVVGPSMLSLDGAEHMRHRRPFVEPFRPRLVEQRYADRTTDLAEELLDRVRVDGRADLRPTLAGPLSVAVMAAVLGLADVDAATVLRWYGAIVEAVSRISAGEAPSPDAATAMADLSAHLSAGVRDDSVLRGAGDRLTDEEVISNAAVMLFGGIETTEGMILSAIRHLVADPSVLAVVRDDQALVPAVVEESLRLEPAASAVDRYATRDVELGGVRIGRGDLVRVSIAGANRDPDVFADPDRFDPARPNVRDQLAFARGPHVCIAMDLARLEARAAVSAVLGLPGVRVEGPVRATGLIFRKPTALPLVWQV